MAQGHFVLEHIPTGKIWKGDEFVKENNEINSIMKNYYVNSHMSIFINSNMTIIPNEILKFCTLTFVEKPSDY